jgi:hypothetical protein
MDGWMDGWIDRVVAWRFVSRNLRLPCAKQRQGLHRGSPLLGVLMVRFLPSHPDMLTRDPLPSFPSLPELRQPLDDLSRASAPGAVHARTARPTGARGARYRGLEGLRAWSSRCALRCATRMGSSPAASSVRRPKRQRTSSPRALLAEVQRSEAGLDIATLLIDCDAHAMVLERDDPKGRLIRLG